MTIHRPAEPPIIIRKTYGPWLTSLYADEICSAFERGFRRCRPHEIVIDTGTAVAVGNTPGEADRLELPGALRGVEYQSADGFKYVLVASFGKDPLPEIEGELLARTAKAALWKRQA